MAATKNAGDMAVVPKASVELFGTHANGADVHRICLTSEVGGKACGASILTLGATVQAVSVPDKDGNVEDVVLGFGDLSGYCGGTNFCYGGTPGRYANRIKEGRFTLEGQTHNLTANWEGSSGTKHCLHGGATSFDKRIWSIEKGPWVDHEGAHVVLSYFSQCGEEGFPGNLTVKTQYTWQAVPGDTIQYNLKIKWDGTTDRATVVNLTNHSYFNLSGVKTASQVLDSHMVQLNCDRWTEVNEDAIPSGNLLSVQDTCMDFRVLKKVGENIKDAQGGGYDHNWVVSGEPEAPGLKRYVGRVECTSGRTMECWATQPGVQFFTMQPANVFDKATTGKFGQVYPVHGGLCLETQHFPDSPNQPGFPTTTISPSRPYSESCSYRFSVK